jgi:hypothetical protein
MSGSYAERSGPAAWESAVGLSTAEVPQNRVLPTKSLD